MWTCPTCSERVDNNFGSCWNCQTDRPENVEVDGGINPGNGKEADPIVCLRCSTELEFMGTKNFLEGTHLAAWLGDTFVNRERLDVYACPRCGHVEFFVDVLKIIERNERSDANP